MRIRKSARIILLDKEHRILLFKYEVEGLVNPQREDVGAFWVTPGGGVEEGETTEAAARRELWEETGLRVPVGRLVYSQVVDLVSYGEPFQSHDHFYSAFTSDTEITFADPQFEEMRDYREHRWWTLADLQETTETVFPERLAEIIERILSTACQSEVERRR